MAGGIALGAACVVTACFQTVKACDIIENANIQMDNIEEGTGPDDVKEQETKKVRKATNIKLVKTYILPASLGIGSVACILASYKILASEKAAAVAALSSVTAAFEKYRARVIEKYGAEADYELYNGEFRTEHEDSDGNKVVVVTKNPIDDNCYTKIFSYETSGEWKWKKSLNVAFLDYYERYWNEQLRTKGYVTYNEVIESLGFSRKVGDGMTERFIPNGIGWVSDENIPKELEGQFDTFISFVPRDKDFTDDIDAVYEDLGYVLRFNCYPIDNLLMQRDSKFNSKPCV
jgi:hypothetical protein